MPIRVRGVTADPAEMRRKAEERGLTVVEIAERTLISRSTVKRAFAGHPVERSTLYAIGALFDVVPPSKTLVDLIA